jgi:hypothetical protein
VTAMAMTSRTWDHQLDLAPRATGSPPDDSNASGGIPPGMAPLGSPMCAHQQHAVITSPAVEGRGGGGWPARRWAPPILMDSFL